MFANVDMARRIDTGEARLCAEIAEAVGARRPNERVLIEEIAGGLAVFSGTDSPVNKMVGVGFGCGLDESRLEVIERAFAERDARLQAEVSTLAEPEVHATLTRRGYILQGFEHELGRPLTLLDADPPPVAGIQIEPMSGEDLARWTDVVVTAFEHPDAEGVIGDQAPPRDVLERVIADMSAMRSLRRYVARLDGEIAGGASLRIDGRIAQLCGSATLPRFRRRGIQSALLRARLADAFGEGCDVAIVTTAPGSKSQKNVQRQGFVLLYARALLVKSPGDRRP
ncbi:MAG: GNAT family N-acetyltransferase [Luteitalea sp.]|nr:GNAT family N-acetyltransferase [Luteitalea sp.]